MFEPSYKKTLDHNYIIFPIPEDMDIDYQINMISENDIPGLIRMQPRSDQDGPQLYYEISSLQPLKRMYEHRTISDDEIRVILGNILSVYRSLRDYMLDDSHLLLKPEYIYVDAVSLKPSLIFLPFFEQERNKSLLTLCEFFMNRSSHEGSDPDMLSYRLYHLIRLENIVPADIQKLLDEPAASSSFSARSSSYEETALTEPVVPAAKAPDIEAPVNKTDTEEKNSKSLPVIPAVTALIGLLICLVPSNISRISRSGKLGGIALMLTGIIMFLISIKNKTGKNSADQKGSVNADPSEQNEFDSYFSDTVPVTREDNDENYGKTIFIESNPGDIEGILIEKTKKEEHPLTTFPFTIGKLKERVDLELKDRSVSRIHARILKEDDKYYLQDCGSTNGTFINGIQLQTEETVPIEKDDEIGIGRVRFVLA